VDHYTSNESYDLSHKLVVGVPAHQFLKHVAVFSLTVPTI